MTLDEFTNELKRKLIELQEKNDHEQEMEDLDDKIGARHFTNQTEQDLGRWLYSHRDLLNALLNQLQKISILELSLEIQKTLADHWRQRGQENMVRQQDIDIIESVVHLKIQGLERDLILTRSALERANERNGILQDTEQRVVRLIDLATRNSHVNSLAIMEILRGE